MARGRELSKLDREIAQRHAQPDDRMMVDGGHAVRH